MFAAGSGTRLAAGWIGLAASAALVAVAITGLYRGMRDLMITSGGTCASGGPYQVANQCSDGQMVLLFAGVPALLVGAALHALFTEWVDGPRIGIFAILGAMFAALGWNFMQLGLDDPTGGGAVPGWIVCGVLFWLMAPGFAAGAIARAAGWVRRGGEPEPPMFSPEVLRSVFGERQ